MNIYENICLQFEKKNDEEKMKKKSFRIVAQKKFEFFFFDWLVFLSFSNKNKVKKKKD